MKTLFQTLAHPLAEALGWALLHSLWQGLVVVLLAKIALHLIPANRPDVRYVVSLSGLALILLAGAVTVSLFLPEPRDIPTVVHYPVVTPAAIVTPSSVSLFHEASRFIEAQIPFILTLWIAGVLFCTLRLVAGWAFITRLRATAMPVTQSWRDLLEDLKVQLGLTADIVLSESAHISVPAVVGFFKPVILVPVGMLTGLSQQQVEAILLHELSHIRRHDFLINTLQSLMEVLYFFNPFVWMLSSIARNEREYCCDDQVVGCYHPRIYAEALAYLEAVRLKKPALALSLAGEKNNLLYRIQRFMEKSKRNNPVPQWIIPVVLAVAGVISMSWLTIGNDPARDEASRNAHAQAAAPVATTDTIVNPTEKRAMWSRKKTVTIGEDGQPREQIVESFQGDEELRDSIDLDFDFDLDWSTDAGAFTWQLDSGDFVYDFDFRFDTLIDQGTFHFAPIPDLHFSIDSLPPFTDDVQAFREEFETMFEERFSDFYKEHSEDLQEMMDGIQEKFNDDEWHENLELQMKEMEKRVEELVEEMKESRLDQQTLMHRKMLQQNAQQRQLLDKTIAKQNRLHHEQRMAARKQMEMANRQMHKVAKHVALQEALREELIKDGYLGKDEPLRTLRWSNDDLEVNGKKVKSKDAKKYKKLSEERLSE